jgi:hypothetical protein
LGLAALREGLALFESLEDKRGTAEAYQAYAYKLQQLGDYRHAREVAMASQNLALEVGSKRLVAEAKRLLAVVMMGHGDHGSVQKILEESLLLFEQEHSRLGVPLATDALATHLYRQGDYDGAEAYSRASQTAWWEMGNRANAAGATLGLGMIAWRQNHPVEAVARLREGLDGLGSAEGHDDRVAWGLLGLARVADTNAPAERVATLLGAAEALCPESRTDLFGTRAEIQQLTSVVRARLDDTTFDTAYEKGQAMSRSEAIAFGLSEATL